MQEGTQPVQSSPDTVLNDKPTEEDEVYLQRERSRNSKNIGQETAMSMPQADTRFGHAHTQQISERNGGHGTLENGSLEKNNTQTWSERISEGVRPISTNNKIRSKKLSRFSGTMTHARLQIVKNLN